MFLFGAYYLRTYGTLKSDRVVATVGIGVVLGFFIAVIIGRIYEFFMGQIPQGNYFLIMFFGSYIVAFVIGVYASKRLDHDRK